MLEKEMVSSPSAKAQLPRLVLYQKKVQDSHTDKDHGGRDGDIVKTFFKTAFGAKNVAFAPECCSQTAFALLNKYKNR